MQAHGLKGFKKAGFKHAVGAALAASTTLHAQSGGRQEVSPTQHPTQHQARSSHDKAVDGPHELYCPISFVLMTEDPVLTSDHRTYERSAIEGWFQRHENSSGVRSPMTDEVLTSLELFLNVTLRNMARSFAERQN